MRKVFRFILEGLGLLTIIAFIFDATWLSIKLGSPKRAWKYIKEILDDF